MDVCGPIVEPERLADKRLAPSLGRLPELVQQIRGLREGSLGGTREVDPAQEEMSARGVWGDASHGGAPGERGRGEVSRLAEADRARWAGFSDIPLKKAEDECM